jgi:predicted MFS family arabinose efflux permease
MTDSPLLPSVAGGRSTQSLTVLAIVFGCFTGQSFARFSFGLLLPAMKADLHISYGLAGWLGTINLGGYLAGTLLTSAASLRVPAHRLVQTGIGIATVGMLVLAFASSLPFLLLGMALGGIGGAMAWIPAPVVNASVFAPERRSFAMGICSAAIGTGIVMATIIVRGVRAWTNDPSLWRLIWLIQAIIGALTFVVALVVLKPVELTPGSPPRISVLRRVPRWWAPTAAYACFGLGYVLFTTYVVSALVVDAKFSNGHATWVFAGIGAGNTAGALSASSLLRRFGRRVVMPGTFLAAAVGCLSVLIGREPIVSISTVLFGFGMAAGVVCITSYLGETIRPQDFSAAFGVMTACFGAAQTVGPRLGGYMVDHLGTFSEVFVLAAACWLVGAVCALGLPRRIG